MTQPALLVKTMLLQNCLSWFQTDFRESVVSLIETQFPNHPLPFEIGSVLDRLDQIRRLIDATSDQVDIVAFFTEKWSASSEELTYFKQILLRYRRHVAARTEVLQEKTFHLGILQTLEEEISTLDAVVEAGWFQLVKPVKLPRASDFLPIQSIEQSSIRQIDFPQRQYDEKFHILQAPALFLQDLAYFRAKCEMRASPLTVAFLDIDDFKRFNSAHSETKVDRNLLPRFMQALEAHVYHHGFAYRQGGDEYLVLLPSLSQEFSLNFLDEIRRRLADQRYPDIDGTTTVSIGVCFAESDCLLTDRELRDRANQAKEFAKRQGKNCIASYRGPLLVREELMVARPSK